MTERTVLELRFTIDVFTPDTIPMARLAEYMAELAALLGNQQSVHFVRLEAGSAGLVHHVDQQDAPKVRARLRAVVRGEPPPDAVKPYRKMDRMLAEDNAVGTLTESDGAVIIPFPGRTRPKPIDFGVIPQTGTIEGIPMRLGGTRENVPVHIQELGPAATLRVCETTRKLARAIAAYLFETPIRAYGSGRWHRSDDGVWVLDGFIITHFEVLDNAPLEIIVEQLRSIPDADWRKTDQALEFLRTLRKEDGDA